MRSIRLILVPWSLLQKIEYLPHELTESVTLLSPVAGTEDLSSVTEPVGGDEDKTENPVKRKMNKQIITWDHFPGNTPDAALDIFISYLPEQDSTPLPTLREGFEHSRGPAKSSLQEPL